MKYQPKYPAAFINNIAEEGTKAEAIEWLHRTWDELVDVRKNLSECYKKEGIIEFPNSKGSREQFE